MKKCRKIFGLNLGWPKKVGAKSPLWKIQSPECWVNEKILKNVFTLNWDDQKSWPRHPLWKIQSRVLSKQKKFRKNFRFQIWRHQKKLASRLPSKKFRVHSALWMKKFRKIFWPQIWHDLKKLVPRPPLKNSECRVLGTWINSEKNFDLKFGMTKKSWPRTPLWKIHSPECSVNEKNDWPQIWHDYKKLA